VSTAITPTPPPDDRVQRWSVPPLTAPEWERIQARALVAAGAGAALFAVVGLILSLAGGVHSPLQFFLSYLVAYNFWVSIPLGCLVILMVQHLTGGAWGLVLRRVLESGSATLLPLAVLFVPLVVGLFLGPDSLYLWARPDQVAGDEELRHKALYLNPGFFVARAVGYFVIWFVLAYFLNGWSAEQDREASPGLPRRFRLLSGPGLVLYGLTITFASVDWVMSLEPHWYSTIYPVLFAVGQLLTGFAFAVAVLVLLAQRPPLSEVVTRAHLRDLGSLLLAFVMFWAYMAFSQYLLIWAGNLPEEIPYYLRRTRAGWEWVALGLILLHFALPFLLLVSRDVKGNPRALAAVAVGLLVMRFVDIFWWIEPAYPHEGQYFYWLLDVAAAAGLGGVWVWWFVRQLKRRPLLPLYAPGSEEGAAHE
jgi:hypothetical protein